MSDIQHDHGISRSADILQFAAKTCILAVVLSASILFVANWIINRAELSIARTVSAMREEVMKLPIDGTQFWGKFESNLEWAAAPVNDLSPERKRKLANNLRVIVARWRPVVEAVRTEIRDHPPTDQR
jgi:hypothetical protein